MSDNNIDLETGENLSTALENALEKVKEAENEEEFEDINLNETQKRWTRRLTKRIREYAFQAMGFSYMTGTDAAYFNSYNSWVNLVIQILSAILIVGIGGTTAMIAAIMSNVNNNEEVNAWLQGFLYFLQVVNIGISLAIAILKGVQSAKGLVKKIINFSISSAKFAELYRNIKDQFSFESVDRDDAITLIRYIQRRFDELEREKPFIRDGTTLAWQEHVSQVKNSPEKYETIIELPEELKDVAYLGPNAEEGINNREISTISKLKKNQKFKGDIGSYTECMF